MNEVKLNMLMMGKTGHGKSATANMILNKRVNKTGSSTASQTKDVSFNFANFDQYVLLVVDGLGLEDTDLIEDKEVAAKNMSKALGMCYGGVDAFLFVHRFGSRMTREERSAVDALKQIFGDSFMNHVIVVMTYGDQFHGAMEVERRHMSFDDWCREQTGEFRQLFEDCDGRVVLFNNRETDVARKRAQIGQIAQLTHNLQTKSGRYNSLCFQLAERERKILILNHKAPHLRREFQEKMCILIGDIDNLSTTSSNSDEERVRKRIIDLKCEIIIQDEGCDALQDLICLIYDMEDSLNDVEQLIYLNRKLENIRRAKVIWNVLGEVCAVHSGVIYLVHRPAEKCIDGGIDKRLIDVSKREVITEQQMGENEKQLKKLRLATKQDDQKDGQKEVKYAERESQVEQTRTEEQSQQNKVKIRKGTLNFLLMGKTGHGKSSTGNMLLNRRVFKASSQTSGTRDVDFNFSKFEQYVLLVVDGPALEDSDLDKTTDKERALRNMSKALAMCYGGIDAFLLVVKFGNRFTAEEKAAVRALKVIFGNTFMEHVIVVVTGGDIFQTELNDISNDISFQDWCKEQTGAFRQLYEDCEGRFVLFNNREKDEVKKLAQIHQIVQLASDLQKLHGRYTSQCFLDAGREREKLILSFNVPQLHLQIQEKISLLSGAIENLPPQASIGDREKIRNLISELNCEIDKMEGKYGVLQNLKDLTKKIEQNLDNSWELKYSCQELEKIRRAENAWGSLSPVGIVIGMAVAVAALAVGPTAAVVGAVVLGISSLYFTVKK